MIEIPALARLPDRISTMTEALGWFEFGVIVLMTIGVIYSI